MADETQLFETWAVATLTEDATLVAMLGRYIDPATSTDLGPSIFAGDIPQGAAYPVVLIEWIPGGRGDLYYNGARRAMSGSFYRISAIKECSDYESVSVIASRIDTLLSLQNVAPVTGGNVLQCIRFHPDKRPRFE